MSVYSSTVSLEGALLEGVNPLPKFRNSEYHRVVPDNGSLKDDLKMNLGLNAGERYLPYMMQDRYSRSREMVELKTVILENEYLKAVFLPEFGGRLYSLTNQITGKELLYTNPVLQPANLAILNAWFSGGIEWNVGQLGHAFSTASSVHVAQLVDDEGHDFIRIYEYERCKNVTWQIDFHLPPGAKQLACYGKITNDTDKPTSMYYWTNIAVPETEGARVFSSTDEVIYIDHHVKGFGQGHLPHLPTVPNKDLTYPMQFPFSNEYFFVTPSDVASPWEAVSYEDGSMFFERSTSMLRYRKMFCWGNHIGGRKWCDFLSKPGEGNYIEIQGGFAPTQLHGMEMPPHTEYEFTQLFGGGSIDTEKTNHANWHVAREYVEQEVESILPAQDVQALHEKLRQLSTYQPTKLLHSGTGWGMLEKLRREKMGQGTISESLLFTEDQLTDEQSTWLQLLNNGIFPELDVDFIPSSWMVQQEWIDLLAESLKRAENQNWYAYMHYGVMLFEAGLENEAMKAWETSLSIKPSPWVYRHLAVAKQRAQDLDAAISYYQKAYDIKQGFSDPAFLEEYLDILIQAKQYVQAWEIYKSLPENSIKTERLRIIVGAAALELNEESYLKSLFETEFAVIREGEITIVELWYQYHAKQLAQSRGTEVTEEILKEAKQSYPPPKNIDFRMIGEE